MEREIYEFILLKINELSKYEISYSSEKINDYYNSLLNSGMTLDEIKEKINIVFEKAIKDKKNEILNSKALTGEYSNYNSIIDTINILLNSELKSFVTIYGGTVPYLITGEIPKRIIGDVDLHVSLENMDYIRKYIREHSELFHTLIDTINYSNEDFGLEMEINGVNVSIFPTIITEDGKIVKNFQYQESIGKISEKATMFYGLTEENSTCTYLFNDAEIKLEIPEYIFIQKSNTLREKDRIDIEVLNKIVDQRKIDYLKKITKKQDVIMQKEIIINQGCEEAKKI